MRSGESATKAAVTGDIYRGFGPYYLVVAGALLSRRRRASACGLRDRCANGGFERASERASEQTRE